MSSRKTEFVDGTGLLRRPLSVTLALILITTGCNSNPDTSRDAGKQYVPQNVTQISLPLDAYLPTPESWERKARARGLLIKDCMARFGLRWSPQTPAQLSEERRQQQVLRNGRFGLVDKRQAATYGYHRPPGHPSLAPHGDHKSDLGPEQNKVYNGLVAQYGGAPVPSGGCSGESLRVLASNANFTDAQLPARLEAEAQSRAAAGGSVSAMLKRWSSCMHRFGYAYRKPGDIYEDPRWGSGPVVSGNEIRLATTDVECKEQSNYLTIVVSARTKEQHKLIERYATSLRDLKRSLAVQDKNIARILQGVTPA